MATYWAKYFLGQVLLVDPTETTEEISQSRPDSFDGVAMDLPQTISVIVAGPFPLRLNDQFSATPCLFDRPYALDPSV